MGVEFLSLSMAGPTLCHVRQATAHEVQGLGLTGSWAKPRDLSISSRKCGASTGDDIR